MVDIDRHSSSTHRHHHHHKHESRRHQHRTSEIIRLTTNEENKDNIKDKESDFDETDIPETASTLSMNDRILKAKRIILDFRKNNEDDFADLKTQFNLLDNGYSVDLGKVPNSLLQGTLQIIFTIIGVAVTNRGYFWNEEDFDGKQIYDLFGDCFESDITSLERSLQAKRSIAISAADDSNAIDLDDMEEEEEEEEDIVMGPSLPPPVVMTKEVEIGEKRMVGPIIPDTILQLLSRGVDITMINEDTPDESEDDIGPALPGCEARKPAEETIAYLQELKEETERKERGEEKPLKKERSEWMTMMPEKGISSAFANVKPRRFANIPVGCAMDASWAETPEQREKRIHDHLNKTLIGGLKEETKLSKEEEEEKKKKMEQYFDEVEKERCSESLASIYKRLVHTIYQILLKKNSQNQDDSANNDDYSRDSIFKRSTRKMKESRGGADFMSNSGTLSSRFGNVTYKTGSS